MYPCTPTQTYPEIQGYRVPKCTQKRTQKRTQKLKKNGKTMENDFTSWKNQYLNPAIMSNPHCLGFNMQWQRRGGGWISSRKLDGTAPKAPRPDKTVIPPGKHHLIEAGESAAVEFLDFFIRYHKNDNTDFSAEMGVLSARIKQTYDQVRGVRALTDEEQSDIERLRAQRRELAERLRGYAAELATAAGCTVMPPAWTDSDTDARSSEKAARNPKKSTGAPLPEYVATKPIEPDYGTTQPLEAFDGFIQPLPHGFYSSFSRSTFYANVLRRSYRYGLEQCADIAFYFGFGTVSRDIVPGLPGIWDNAAAFAYYDYFGTCRGVKIMQYGNDGHRRKDIKQPCAWLHTFSQTEKPSGRVRCFYNEQELKSNPGAPVRIVESEKTAIIASIENPAFVWLATGGNSQLKGLLNRGVLSGRVVELFPDALHVDEWRAIMPDIQADGAKLVSCFDTSTLSNLVQGIPDFDYSDVIEAARNAIWQEMKIAGVFAPYTIESYYAAKKADKAEISPETPRQSSDSTADENGQHAPTSSKRTDAVSGILDSVEVCAMVEDFGLIMTRYGIPTAAELKSQADEAAANARSFERTRRYYEAPEKNSITDNVR